MCHQVTAAEFVEAMSYLHLHREAPGKSVIDNSYSSANDTESIDVSPLLLNHNWGLWQVRLM